MAVSPLSPSPAASVQSSQTQPPPAVAQLEDSAVKAADRLESVVAEEMNHYRGKIPRSTLEKWLTIGKQSKVKAIALMLGMTFYIFKIMLTDLPREAKGKSFRYLLGGFWVDTVKGLFKKNPYLPLKKLTSYMGAPTLKIMQLIGSGLKHRVPLLKHDTNLISRIIVHMGEGFFIPMLKSVHPVEQTKLQPFINEVISKYNQAFPKNKIVETSGQKLELLGSASIAQVYKVHCADGAPLALKVNRPEIYGEKYMKEYKSFITKLILMFGDHPRNFDDTLASRAGAARKLSAAALKKKETELIDFAIRIGHETIDFFKDEVNMLREQQYGALLKRDFEALGIQNIHFPQILSATNRASLQEFAHGSTLVDASPELARKVAKQVAVDDIRGKIFAPTLHLDDHPGNELVYQDPKTGKLTYYLIDYGRTLTVPSEIHRQLLRFNTKLLMLSAELPEMRPGKLSGALTDDQLKTLLPEFDVLLQQPNRVPEEAKLNIMRRMAKDATVCDLMPYRTLLWLKRFSQYHPVTLDLHSISDFGLQEARNKGELSTASKIFAWALSGASFHDDLPMIEGLKNDLKNLDLMTIFGSHSNHIPATARVKPPEAFSRVFDISPPPASRKQGRSKAETVPPIQDVQAVERTVLDILNGPSSGARQWLAAYLSVYQQIGALSKKIVDELVKVPGQSSLKPLEQERLVRNLQTNLWRFGFQSHINPLRGLCEEFTYRGQTAGIEKAAA